MRIRSVYKEGDKTLYIDGKKDCFILSGGAGTERKSVLRGVLESFICGREKKKAETREHKKASLPVGKWFYEFDIGKTIQTSIFESGALLSSIDLENITDLQSIKKSAVRLSHGVLYYSSDMIYDENLNGNVVYPYIDLHTSDIRESIVIIDDFGVGLSLTESESLMRHLLSLCKSKGNQLVFGVSRVEEYMRKMSGIMGIQELQEQQDILYELQQILKQDWE